MLARTPALLSKLVDEGRFIRQWVSSPLTIGAIAPSGPNLAKSMAAYVDPAIDGPVVELGPGTGAVTRALLQRGVRQERLIAVEYCSEFVELLRARHPNLRVVQGDAFDFTAYLGDHAPLAAIVSSLPLFTSAPAKRLRLIREALGRLAPGRPFIQFSYAFVPPVRPVEQEFSASPSDWIWPNVPPARVWVYRGNPSQPPPA